MQTFKYKLPDTGCSPQFSGNACILDIQTEGRYWRNSHLISVSVISLEEETPVLVTWLGEKEADEYDILCELRRFLSGKSPILTFNGTSFDLPHLQAKYAAYRLGNPFEGKDHQDLYLLLRPLNGVLPIRSHRLADYLSCLETVGVQSSGADAVNTLRLTVLMDLLSFMKGDFMTGEAAISGSTLLVPLVTDRLLPPALSVSDGPFSLVISEEGALLEAKVFDGKLRRYYTNIQDYDYLPLEGCAVHKSVSAYVGRSRKEKAVRENCFTLISCSPAFLSDARALKKYASSVLLYLLTRPAPPVREMA